MLILFVFGPLGFVCAKQINFEKQNYPEILKRMKKAKLKISRASLVVKKRNLDVQLSNCENNICFLDNFEISQDNVQLDCEQKEIWPRSEAEIAIIINANNVSVVNCVIKSFDTAIKVIGSKNIITKNTIINNNEGAIEAYGDNNKIFNNTLSNNEKYGVYLRAKSNDNIVYKNQIVNTVLFQPYSGAIGAIGVAGSKNAVLENTIKNNSEIGIKLAKFFVKSPAPFNNLIAENKIINSGVLGIEITGAVPKKPVNKNIPKTSISLGKNIVFDNHIFGSKKEFGLRIRWSNNNRIIGNIIRKNKWQGIHILSAKRNLISGNFVSRNSREGIWLGDANENEIYSNTISNNDAHCGILFTKWRKKISENNIAKGNTFSGNGKLHNQKQICDEDRNLIDENEFK